MPSLRRSAAFALAAASLLGSAEAAANPRLRRSQLSLSAKATYAHEKGEENNTLLHQGESVPRAPIRKPVTDDRDYLYTTFDSGLKVLVVNDASAKRMGFAVAVEVGSLEDPPEFQGLAHFCEHMLFLGSEKYNDTDAFSEVLAHYGGNHNAYTSSEMTVYFNEIGVEGIEKGLDIFAQFFISPSFESSMVDKEVNAVDSEHKKNKPDGQRRLWHLLRSRANPKNPAHQFSTGDLATLKTDPESKGLSLPKALRKFHNENYCANRLHLVLVGNMSTTEQLELAHRHFDAIPAATKESCPGRPHYTKFPQYTKELGNLGRWFTLGTHGAPEMWLVLPTPPETVNYKAVAEAYLSNAMANYDKGSLKALLLQEELSTSYSFYVDSSPAGSQIFVRFMLTQKGSESPERVLEYFFAYVNTIRKAGVDQKLLSDIQQLRQLGFDYQEKKASEFSFVSTVAGSLPKYDPADVLTGGLLIDKPDVALINKIMDSVVPTNMNVAFVNPKFDESKANSHEKYYDVSYDEAPISEELVKRLSGASGFGLLPPPQLAFVPRNLALTTERAKNNRPEELVQSDRVTGWWLGPGNIELPKAMIQMKIAFPASSERTADKAVLAAMHGRIVQRVLEQSADNLLTCGYHYSVSAAPEGFSVSFSGFDEHLDRLANLVLPKVRETGSEGEAVFDQVRRQLLLELSDVTQMQPYQHAMEAFEVVTIKGRFSRAEMVKEVSSTERVSTKTYHAFLEEIFAGATLSVMVSGNINRERAQGMIKEAGSTLKLHGKVSGEAKDSLQVLDPSEPLEVRVTNPIVGDPNSATLLTYQFGVPSIADRAQLSMLGEVMNRPVFESLRTERQLGYVVFGYVAPHSSIIEVRVLVQGFKESPDTVEMLAEETLKNLTARIINLPAAELASRRKSLRSQLAQPPATLGAFAGQYWDQIWKDEYCFEKKQLLIDYLDQEEARAANNASHAPSKAMLDVWLRAVNPACGVRKKVTVKLFGAGALGRPDPQQPVAQNSSAQPITLLDSASLGQRMKNEKYWPSDFICH